ncbi:hypothetical protein [Jiella sp. M17.18]|uniref:hypothetical protein n=1 Tax=Jiella sp. M17.18 TaxID=3234247 RepID=UPI0034DFA6EF
MRDDQSEPRPEERRGATGEAAAPPRGGITLFGRRLPLPGSRIGRIVVGALLILGGILGFLPILGFWMIPLGLVVLSVDLAPVRRFRRRVEVRWGRRRGRGANERSA